jgi:hypothetical protein
MLTTKAIGKAAGKAAGKVQVKAHKFSGKSIGKAAGKGTAKAHQWLPNATEQPTLPPIVFDPNSGQYQPSDD